MTLENTQLIAAAFIGAATSGIPLLYKFLALRLKFKTDTLKVDKEQAKMDDAKSINKEEEWKRIIQFRDAELTRLRERDEGQDRQLKDLYDRFIEAQKSEARKDERVKVLEERVNQLTALLVNRCPECPSLQLLTRRVSDKLPVLSPEPTEIPEGSH